MELFPGWLALIFSLLNDNNELHCCITFERQVIATWFERNVMPYEKLLTKMLCTSGLRLTSGLIDKNRFRGEDEFLSWHVIVAW